MTQNNVSTIIFNFDIILNPYKTFCHFRINTVVITTYQEYVAFKLF